MKTFIYLLTGIFITTFTLSSVSAQGRRGGPNGRGGQLEGIKAGDALPNVNGLTESGKTVNLRDLLADHYAVIVFGCLT